jgi:hypothetical protein
MAMRKIFILFLFLGSSSLCFAVNEKPIEQHNLLGNPVLMDYLTCVQKYGADFCKCNTMDSGTKVCYYHKPPAGFYTKEKCESIWGTGGCEDKGDGTTNDRWAKIDGSSGAGGTECDGEVFIFPGDQQECRSKTGIVGLGGSCCFKKSGNACSFNETAETLGWDSAVIEAIGRAAEFAAQKWATPIMADWMKETLGGAMIGSGNTAVDYMASQILQDNYATQNIDGTLIGDILPFQGETVVDKIASNIADVSGLANADMIASEASGVYADAIASGQGVEAAKGAVSEYLDDVAIQNQNPALAFQSDTIANNVDSLASAGGDAVAAASSKISEAFCNSAMSGVFSVGMAMLDGELTSEEMMDAMAGMAVAFAGSFIPGLNMAYMAYKVYNMLTAETECLPGEKTLACKVGENYCHYVGERCTQKIFGHCLAKKKSYCCFNSLLARVIHEQGRMLLGSKFIPPCYKNNNPQGCDNGCWGDAEDPVCRGFTPSEFAFIDFSKMDLSEYIENVTDRAAIDVDKSIDGALQRLEDQMSIQVQ